MPVSPSPQLLGRLVAAHVYPLKSAAGVPVSRISLEREGIADDRRWALCDSAGRLGSGKSGARFFRAPGLIDCSLAYRQGRVEVQVPGHDFCALDDPALSVALSDFLKMQVKLKSVDNSSHQDEAPLHLLCTKELRALEELGESWGDARRYRPNLVVELEDEIDEPHLGNRKLALVPESQITDWEAICKAPQIRVVSKTERCSMTSMAQGELAKNSEILKEIVQNHGGKIGEYAKVLQVGTSEVGDCLVSL